jgi:hypothetical protein
MKKAFLAFILASLAAIATAQTTAPRPLGKWAIVKVDPGNSTEVRASECHNHYAPPVQISPGIWRISNPYEQTIQFVCVVWMS